MTVNRDLRRIQLLTSFLDTFSVHGLDRTTMRDLIQESGISSSFIYEMFEGREQMIIECVRFYYYRKMIDPYEALINDPNLSIPGIIDGIVAIVKQNVRYHRFLLQVLLHPVYHDDCLDVITHFEEFLLRVSDRFAEKSGVDPDSSYLAVISMESIVHAYTIMHDEKLFDVQIERLKRFWQRSISGETTCMTLEKVSGLRER